MQTDSPVGLEQGFRLGANYGYRIDGDTASLNADLAIVRDEARRTAWALQLWACEAPYEGGSLQGTKVAEVPVAGPSPEGAPTLPLEAVAFANIPPSRRDYCMVFVLASGEPGGFEQVRDFVNYPRRERFVVPHLEGSVGYSIDGDTVVLSVERIRNPRASENLSGSLAVELWGLQEPYSGGPLEGVVLASAAAGQLGGQCTFEGLQCCIAFSQPPPGQWQMALVLREWTAAGFATRDCFNFPVPFGNAEGVPDVAPSLHSNGVSAEHAATYSELPARPSSEEIALAAYYRHLARGQSPGNPVDDWLEAEQELLRAWMSAASHGPS